jgi:hypothetical protein
MVVARRGQRGDGWGAMGWIWPAFVAKVGRNRATEKLGGAMTFAKALGLGRSTMARETRLTRGVFPAVAVGLRSVQVDGADMMTPQVSGRAPRRERAMAVGLVGRA